VDTYVDILISSNIYVARLDWRPSALRDTMPAVNWRYFAGAAILAGGLLLKVGAPVPAVAAGVLLAAVINWGADRREPK
jgi:hypothetical protein